MGFLMPSGAGVLTAIEAGFLDLLILLCTIQGPTHGCNITPGEYLLCVRVGIISMLPSLLFNTALGRPDAKLLLKDEDRDSMGST